MQKREIAGIMVIVLLVFSVFYVLPVKAQQYLKVGVIGPEGWIEGQGMFKGAELARDWINGLGDGIVIEGTRYDVSLHFEYTDPTTDFPPLDLRARMERLITEEEVDFVVGGVRSEAVFVMREVAMDYNKLFFICGAAANYLIDCGAGTCGACVRCDYARYKYLFRVMPVNDTMPLLNLVGFLSGYVLPYRLVPLYGKQLFAGPELDIKVAVLAEDFDWTVDMYNAIVYAGYLGPHAHIVYSARIPYPTADLSSYLDAMHAAEVRLIVHIYSTGYSIALVQQMTPHPLKAVLVGIDAIGQISDFWTYTEGACQYETFLAYLGTGTPVSEVSEPYTTAEFWDLYYATYGHAPMYTSFGAYDAIIAMHDMLEAQTGPTYIHPPFDTADTNALVPIIETTDRESTLGRFKYTTYHDPFSNEYSPTWEQGYVRPLVVQWQTGRLEVVWPSGQAYSKTWILPEKMYNHPTDVDQNGEVKTKDMAAVAWAFGSYPTAPDKPAHPRWQMSADTARPRDRQVTTIDLAAVGTDFDTEYTLPIPY